MTFFVSKRLATGPIRFGVSPRRRLEEIDALPEFSTGTDGMFVCRRDATSFFAASRATPGAAEAPRSQHPNTYLQALLALPRMQLGIIVAGIVLALIGLAVVINKGPQGWIEVILGLAMITVPMIVIARERRIAREREERERAAHEEREKRDRAMLASYSAALERMQAQPDDSTIADVRREREQLELPYELWSPLARHAVLMIGFQSLQSEKLKHLLDSASHAAGLSDEDAAGVRDDIVRTLLWHLAADDRVGAQQSAALDGLRKRLGAALDATEIAGFERLRGIRPETLPRSDCNLRLGFHEYCIHTSNGLTLTNKRVLLPSQKPAEIALPKIDDLEVDADSSSLTIRADGLKKPLVLRLEDPIYTATLIDLALSLNERPRSFA